jgi:hypothetical protein
MKRVEVAVTRSTGQESSAQSITPRLGLISPPTAVSELFPLPVFHRSAYLDANQLTVSPNENDN